jgi:hypothetical protein
MNVRATSFTAFDMGNYVDWFVIGNHEPGVMKPGQCFTIEPIVIQDDKPTAWIFPDGWTASTEVRQLLQRFHL